jgi:uncharacterized protein (TIGR02391 family)
MIDLHNLRREIRQQLQARWYTLDINTDPFDWVWVVYGMNQDDTTNNSVLAQAFDQARRWLDDDTIWQNDAHLGIIGLLYDLLDRPHSEIWNEQMQSLQGRVERLQEQIPSKFARLNDPDFVFGLAHVARGNVSPALHNRLCDYCLSSADSANVRRAVLFTAAVYELCGATKPLTFIVKDLMPHEIIPLLWLSERYPDLIEGESRRREIWEVYEESRDSISLVETAQAESGLHIASPVDLAMLYEAIVRKTQEIDFITLFNNIPWHPDVQGASGALFQKGEYVAAVFESAKLFVDKVKQRAGNPHDKHGKPLDGGPLMNYVFAPKSPRLKFTPLTNQTEQNEHRGLGLIAEGIVSALRNPKGHLPGATITLTPEEAVEQLAIISYLMRRLDSAT